MCGISTIDFKNPRHWNWLVGRVFAVGGPTYTRQTVYGHLVNLVNFSTFHCHLINFSSLSFHCKLFKVHTMELVSHKIASGHSWRIRWPKDHRQNKWGNTFALLSVKYLFKHFSPAPLFFTKILNKLTHIWFEAIVENLSTVPTRGSAAPRYLKHHCKNITIVQISFCEWIKLVVKLHLRKCSPISSPSHPILANPSLNPSPPHLSQISSSHFSALSNIVEFHWILSQLWTLPQIYFD